MYNMEANNSLDQYLNSIRTKDSQQKEFVKRRILAFDEIDKQFQELKPLLRQAKKETLAYYKKNPNYAVITPTDLILDYIKDIKDILKNE